MTRTGYSGPRWNRRIAALLFVAILAASLSACRKKDIVALAGLDKGDLYVGDVFGNSAMVGNREDFLAALVAATRVTSGTEASLDLSKASHTLWSGAEKIHYNWENKHLIYVDKKGNKTVFAADLHSLLLGIASLPPRIVQGPGADPAISAAIADISRVANPSAALFKTSDGASLLVAGGMRPTAGYQVTLDGAKVGADGTVQVTARLVAPKGPADVVITHPYLELSLAKFVDVEVTLITPGSPDLVERLPLAVVLPDQEIIVYKPDRGSLLTERIRVYGFAKRDLGSFTIAIEDGHDVLGRKEVSLTGSTEDIWAYFDFEMDLRRATSPSGMVDFSKGGETLARIPVSFGGK